MTRRRFSEKDVLRTLIHQGVEIRCYRTKARITLENVHLVQKEHLHEIQLGGPDEPGNCRFSLKDAHAIVSDGSPATTAGSSKHRIAKTKEPRTSRYVVHKRQPGESKPESLWPSRKMENRGFDKNSIQAFRPQRHEKRGRVKPIRKCKHYQCAKPKRTATNPWCARHSNQHIHLVGRNRKPCSLSNCDRPSWCNGMCAAHYEKARRARHATKEQAG